MTRRLWICPECGHSWKNDPTIPEEKRPYPVWPTHYLEATQDNCGGLPVEHFAAPVGEARDGWLSENDTPGQPGWLAAPDVHTPDCVPVLVLAVPS